MRANVADLEHVLLRQVVMRDVCERDAVRRGAGPEPRPAGDPRARSGSGGMFAQRAEVQAARAAEAAGCRSSSRRCRSAAIEEVGGGDVDPAVVPALRDARPRYAEDLMARASAVGAGARAHRRPGGGRSPPPRHPQRHGGRARRVGQADAALDLVSTHGGSATSRWAASRSRSATSRRRCPAPARPRHSATGSTPSSTRASPGTTSPGCASNWDGRLVVKGVLDPEDARRAADAGVDGIVVSNHGGRQLDSVPSTARALPGVAEAVGDQVEVLADGGVRTGLDVVKMMALGRPGVPDRAGWAWAVAGRGEAGVATSSRCCGRTSTSRSA